MRVGYCGLLHETNTFSLDRTQDAAFARYTWRGAAIVEAFAGTATSAGGVIEALRRHRHSLVPLVYAEATPSGTVAGDTYGRLLGELVEAVRGADLDVLVVSLHGAMAAEGAPSADAETLAAIRGAVGPGMPIGVTLDLHANLDPAIAALAQAVVGYATYPHVDSCERAIEVTEIVTDARLQPVVAVAKLPLLSVPQGQFTDGEPMHGLLRSAAQVRGRDGILNCSLFPGFPYADVPNLGFAVAVVADRSAAAAAAAAHDIAAEAWGRREAFTVRNLPPDEAVAAALRAPEGLVALIDVGDNIGGGTPGDGTVLFAELLRFRARGAVVTLADPAAVAAAGAAGVGGPFAAAIGARADPRYGDPVWLRGAVRWLGDGRFRYRCGYMTGKLVLPGRTAVVESDGVEVVLTEHKVPTWDPEQLRVVGIEPRARRIAVLKAAVAWRAGYGDLVSAVVEADTPGACATSFARLEFRNAPRPIHPLDAEAGDRVPVTVTVRR